MALRRGVSDLTLMIQAQLNDAQTSNLSEINLV
jgi:hypothetical protein